MFKKILFTVLYFLVSASSVFAQGFIWKGTGGGTPDTACNVKGPCTFCDSLIAIKNITLFLFEIAFPIAVVMIVYGAIRLMISAASEEQVRNARHIMTSAVVGLVIALSAWIIVNTLLHILAGDPTFAVWNQINCTE